jgi:endonuclease-3
MADQDDLAGVKLPRATTAQRARAAEVGDALAKAYPDAHCELDYTSAHELLVATILSAQATDVSVNKATPALFKAFPTPADYARATPAEIEPYIRTIGLFRNKARSIHEAMRDVCARFGGQVPRTMDELLTLRGVARKTANVVLGNAYTINVGFVVDTHVHRLAGRLGLAPAGANVQQTERALMAVFAEQRERWCDLSHMLIFHGRRACKARGVACGVHPICAAYGQRCELRVSAKGGGEKGTGKKAGGKEAGGKKAGAGKAGGGKGAAKSRKKGASGA